VLCVGLSAVTIGLPGCVQVNAPDRPIEINLNISIRQEVVFRLNDEAQEVIRQNSEFF
jgi:hypothetical protein